MTLEKQVLDMPLASKDNPLVVIEMITYNHEKYIAQAIESVLMQKTNFAYQIIICDDCSTDKTAQICKAFKDKYPDKIDLHLNEKNLGVYLNAKKIHDISHSSNAEYIAMLDGDDYWMDENKLQMQVDFLRENQEYSIVWTQYQEVQNGSFTSVNLWENAESVVTYENFFRPYRTQTLTCLIKRSAFGNYKLSDFQYLADNTMYLICLKYGKGYILNNVTAAYRIHDNGLWSGASDSKKAFAFYANLNEAMERLELFNVPELQEKLSEYMQRTYYCLVNEKTFSRNSFNKLLRLSSQILRFRLMRKKVVVLDFLKFCNPLKLIRAN
jgi:glycosyltransferase involved in cell wall biosynthesis